MGTGYLYDVAVHIASIAGLKGTYCGDGSGSTVDALPMNLPDSPVAVVLDGEQPIIAGNWERWQLNPEAHIYVSQAEGLGASYERARSFKPLLLARLRASITTTQIASLVPLRFREVEDREWPIGSGRHYWVLPFVMEARVNVSTTYVAPTVV